MTEAQVSSVLTERRGHLGILTLNRPQVVNALNMEMVDLITAQLRAWEIDEDVASVLVRGAGDRGLCAGGDILAIYHDIPSGGEHAMEFWEAEYQLNAYIARYPKPYIAWMDGLVLGGGIGISAHGSHRIVTERTRGGMPETTIGFAPDVGGTYLLSRAPGLSGIHAGLTGAHLDASDLIHLGFADYFMPSDALEELIEALSQQDPENALANLVREPAPSQLAAQQGWIDLAYANRDPLDILAALDEGPEQAQQAAATIRTKSPASVAVTLREIREAAAKETLESALAQELFAGREFLSGHDLREGIRAQIVDKDRSPQWSPQSLAQVSEPEVDAYFLPKEPTA